MRTVSLVLCVAVATATPLVAQGGSTLRGRVLSQAGQPLAGALVVRTGSPDTSRADSAGRYALPRLALGRHIFLVSHSGYETIEMEVSFPMDTVLEVDVPLQPAAARPVGERLMTTGFATRRRAAESRRSRSTFLGPEEILARPVRLVTQLFEGVRDIRVQQTGRFGVVQGDGGRCQMKIWIDGQAEQSTRYLDELITVSEILAVEVYPLPTQVPQEFQTGSQLGTLRTASSDCGALLIWRK